MFNLLFNLGLTHTQYRPHTHHSLNSSSLSYITGRGIQTWCPDVHACYHGYFNFAWTSAICCLYRLLIMWLLPWAVHNQQMDLTINECFPKTIYLLSQSPADRLLQVWGWDGLRFHSFHTKLNKSNLTDQRTRVCLNRVACLSPHSLPSMCSSSLPFLQFVLPAGATTASD